MQYILVLENILIRSANPAGYSFLHISYVYICFTNYLQNRLESKIQKKMQVYAWISLLLENVIISASNTCLWKCVCTCKYTASGTCI